MSTKPNRLVQTAQNILHREEELRTLRAALTLLKKMSPAERTLLEDNLHMAVMYGGDVLGIVDELAVRYEAVHGSAVPPAVWHFVQFCRERLRPAVMPRAFMPAARHGSAYSDEQWRIAAMILGAEPGELSDEQIRAALEGEIGAATDAPNPASAVDGSDSRSPSGWGPQGEAIYHTDTCYWVDHIPAQILDCSALPQLMRELGCQWHGNRLAVPLNWKIRTDDGGCAWRLDKPGDDRVSIDLIWEDFKLKRWAAFKNGRPWCSYGPDKTDGRNPRESTVSSPPDTGYEPMNKLLRELAQEKRTEAATELQDRFGQRLALLVLDLRKGLENITKMHDKASAQFCKVTPSSAKCYHDGMAEAARYMLLQIDGKQPIC